MENKYLLLRVIAVLFEIVAWLILVLGILAAVLFVASTGAIDLGTVETPVSLGSLWRLLGLPAVSGFVAAAAVTLISILSFLVFGAIGELVFLLLDIEAETRETARYLRPRV